MVSEESLYEAAEDHQEHSEVKAKHSHLLSRIDQQFSHLVTKPLVEHFQQLLHFLYQSRVFACTLYWIFKLSS